MISEKNNRSFGNNANRLKHVKYVEGETIEYAILPGNERIVFIKSGAGGTAHGYRNAYVRMAQNIHDALGATVVCASNPDVPHLLTDEQEIRQIADESGFVDFDLSFIGVSDGAYHNLSLARRFHETAKMIGINTSYIDISDLQTKLSELPNVCKVLIYGTKDDDFSEAVPTLRNMECSNFTLKCVDGADHRFSGMVEELIDLAGYLYC